MIRMILFAIGIAWMLWGATMGALVGWALGFPASADVGVADMSDCAVLGVIALGAAEFAARRAR